MTTRLWPAILAMAAIVVASNILVQFPLGNWLTWGAFSYPLAFFVTDVTNRLSGPTAARRVVLAGFIAGIACSAVAASGGATTFRIAAASGAAFLVGQLLDVTLFNRLRALSWWKAPLVSSTIGSVLDTIVFFTIAFAAFLPADANTGWAGEVQPVLGVGPGAPYWVSLAVADWSVKMGMALVTLIPFRMLVARAMLRSARA